MRSKSSSVVKNANTFQFGRRGDQQIGGLYLAVMNRSLAGEELEDLEGACPNLGGDWTPRKPRKVVSSSRELVHYGLSSAEGSAAGTAGLARSASSARGV
jgi:hypothetical protein